MKKLVFILMFLGLLVSAAHADTCGTSLMPAFTATQATQLCAKFGSATNHSLIPSADNTYDVGSSTFGWRTGYFDTSIITPLWEGTADVQVKVDSDSQRLFNLGASSDTALTFTFGDAGVTATQGLTISPSTADADDDATLQVGFASGTRGAGITLPGEEVSGGADITYNAGTSDTHIFQIAGTTYETISSSGTTLPVANTYLTVLDGVASVPADVTDIILGSQLSSVALGTSTSGTYNVIQTGAASTGGSGIAFMKSRAVDGTADTIVGNGDTLGLVTGYGADGAAYVTGGRLAFVVSAAPGTNDMPTDMVVSLSPDGSATLGEAMRVTQAKAIVGAGAITSTATGALGWAPVAGANTACNTTCTSACVFGIDTAAPQTWLACTDATADMCLCAGAS